jgi:hypothetical protein
MPGPLLEVFAEMQGSVLWNETQVPVLALMPHFHLHIWNKGALECEGHDGAEFASLEDAILEAFGAEELWSVLVRECGDPRQYAFLITGADGTALTELGFRKF